MLPYEVLHSEALVWVQRQNSAILDQSIIPIAAAQPGCVWRSRSLGALDAQQRPYRIAVSCDHCAGQEAAVQADLAIAALPANLVRPPLQQVPSEFGLPNLGAYQIGMLLAEPQRAPAQRFAQLLKDNFSQFAAQLNPTRTRAA
jgi:DNA-binding transcriptional LysR family regulator